MSFNNFKISIIAFAVSSLLMGTSAIAQPKDNKPQLPKVLNLEDGLSTYDTPDFNLELVNASQTISKLSPKFDSKFDYAPNEWMETRDAANFYHFGDLNLALRIVGSEDWTKYSSAKERKPIDALKVSGNILAAADMSKTFLDDLPLKITRYWETNEGHLVLRYKLENTNSSDIEIGALGIPLIFNNNFYYKHLEETHEENVFSDPYIGYDAGYLQVSRLKGNDKVLLVLPHGDSPFEAYRPLLDDPTPKGITFEGFHEWMVCSKAYAENEWKDSKQWNKPTSIILKKGESREIGLKFVISESVRKIERTLIENKRPVAVGFPGYVLSQDVNASLFVKSSKEIKDIEATPSNVLKVENNGKNASGWNKYSVKGTAWGRAVVTITYADGSKQTVNYKVIKPETKVIEDNGNFLMTKQWYEDNDDLFGRSPSVITYDYEVKRKVLQDQRAWICGISDEGGAGAWLNAIMKQYVEPNQKQVTMMEDFVNQTMWGGIQYSKGDSIYGVRKSMFYYQPDEIPKRTYLDTINFKTWAAWDKKHSEDPGRSYNYPHVTAAYWVMYRLARNHENLITQQSWDWYLSQSYHTATAMAEQAPYYAQFGQMEGSIFLYLLKDLKAEGKIAMAEKLEIIMKKRTQHWSSLPYPFGSEMPWDSTGQEEVYIWSRYFGFNDMATATVNAILAYMPTVPHWAYNGCARRYWDFLYAGKTSRIERMIHHYGSPLNAIPILAEYRSNPDDLYLLRVGYAGLTGALANITEDGFAPAASHSFPSSLWNDGISGDYGSGYYGYAMNSATYLTNSDEFGWLSFGGNHTKDGNWIDVDITTASKNQIFIAPSKTWITLDAGKIDRVSYNTKTGKIKLLFAPKNKYTQEAYLRITVNNKIISIDKYEQNSRGAHIISLSKKNVEIYI